MFNHIICEIYKIEINRTFLTIIYIKFIALLDNKLHSFAQIHPFKTLVKGHLTVSDNIHYWLKNITYEYMKKSHNNNIL